MTQLAIKVPNMACSACAETITKAVQAIDDQASVQADPKTKDVQINSTASADESKQAVEAAGYTVSWFD